MPLQIIHRDITKTHCDAIVNPTDCFYSGSGGADLAIHQAAGAELDRACGELAPIDFGEVAATRGFRLPCKYIIHTMGPIWEGGDKSEPVLLRSCYLNALIKAKRLGARSVAFPLISAGTFGFPKDKALRIAIEAISDYLFSVDSEMEVYICVLDRSAFELSKGIALREYLNRSKRFVYENHALKMERVRGKSSESLLRKEAKEEAGLCPDVYDEPHAPAAASSPRPMCSSPAEAMVEKPKLSKPQSSLEKWIKMQDDTFPVLLLKLIDKKGMTEVECYKKANIHKNVFWKIKNDSKHKPSKPTVIAFAIALELSIEETNALLKSAGFALSHNNLFDMIIEFYIINKVYDVFEINEALYQYDQSCLGC